MKRLRVSTLFLGIAAAAAVAGCGSSSTDTTTASSAAFKSQASAICTAAFNKVNAQKLPTTNAAVVKVQHDSAAFFNAALARLSQLQPSGDAKGRYQRWLTTFKQVPAVDSEAATVAKAHGVLSSQFLALAPKFREAVAKANSAAVGAGIPDCALKKG